MANFVSNVKRFVSQVLGWCVKPGLVGSRISDILFCAILFLYSCMLSGYAISGLFITLGCVGMYVFQRKKWSILLPIATVIVAMINCRIPWKLCYLGMGVVTTFLSWLFCFIFVLWYQKQEDKISFDAFFFLPVLLTVVTELAYRSPNGLLHLYAGRYSLTFFAAIEPLLILAVMFALAAFFNRKIAAIVASVFFGVMWCANYYVISITSQPIIPSDINNLSTGLEMAGKAQLPSDCVFPFICLIVAVIAMVAYSFFTIKWSPLPKIKPIFVWCKRFVIVSIMAGIIWIGAITFGYIGTMSTLPLFMGHIKYSYWGNLMLQTRFELEYPEDIEIYLTADVNPTITEDTHTPTVIVIMDEAFSDLQSQFDLGGEDALPYFHSLCEQYPSGTLYTSVWGNNTCSTEFEFLTGTAVASTCNGSTIYQSHEGKIQSLFSMFKSYGYDTVAFHPHYSYGYNRANYYKSSYCVDEEIFYEDVKSELTTDDLMRDYVTDEFDFEYIISKYESHKESSDNPLFLFNITMQNHASYHEDPELEEVITPSDDYSIEYQYYLTLIHETDNQLKKLIEYFEGVDEDVVILFFGDHQPMLDNEIYRNKYGVDPSFLTGEGLESRYNTPYLIWANYELNEDENPGRISANYLSTVLCNVADIPLNSWLMINDTFKDLYPIVTTNFVEHADGTIFGYNECNVINCDIYFIDRYYKARVYAAENGLNE